MMIRFNKIVQNRSVKKKITKKKLQLQSVK